jgi:hypothetical protein
MGTLLERLRNHDWFYAYSDDHRVWKRGCQALKSLSVDLRQLDCPYDIGDIRMTVQNMILEDFVEEEPNRWYRTPRKYKNVAPTQRHGLIERARAEEILEWITSQKKDDQ